MSSTMTETIPQDLPPKFEDADEISLIDLLIVLAKHKKLIIRATLGAALIALVVSLLLPNIYTGTAKILPPQQSQSASAAALLGQLGPLAGLGGSALGVKSSNDLYVGMLQSRSVADAIIKQFRLQSVYHAKTETDTRKRLKDATKVTSGKDGIITIEVNDKDPKRAADITNAYVAQLAKLNQTLAVTEAARRRLFFDKQMKQAKDNLADAEVALKNTQKQSGLIQLDAQGRAIIEAVAKLRAQIVAKEVQLGAMGTFATGQNSEYVRTQQELAGLKEQLGKMENDIADTSGSGNVFVPTGRVPESGMEYMRKVRDVKYFETIYELIAKQFELAKIDEAKDSSLVQVLDKAILPEKKSAPKRASIVIVSALGAGILAMLLALFREAAEKAKGDPDSVERMVLLWRLLKR